MEERLDAFGMLDLMVHPGFCVKDNIILHANQAALALMLTPGKTVSELLRTGKEEYAAFKGDCLYLTLDIGGECRSASVTQVEDYHVFLLDQDADQAELQAMALAAQELREPLAKVMITADRLFPMAALQDDPEHREQAARLNRGLLQLLRVIGNMSDAQRYAADRGANLETRNVTSLMQEIFDRSGELVSQAGVTLTFRNLDAPVDCLVDSEKLERAVLNILSNAIKFTPQGGTVDCSLTRRGNMLCLQVQDSGTGIPDAIRSQLHSRYRRQPGIEESRYGIGLGMVLIRSAAAIHGGAVLVDRPDGCGTRITMTLAIRRAQGSTLRSPVLRMDYAGERDHGLVELSESLPAFLYEKN